MILAVFTLLILLVATTVIYTLVTGISPASTSPKVLKVLLACLPQEANGPVLELGCGWGGVVSAVTDLRPGWKMLGYELSPLPFLICWIRTKLSKGNGSVVRHNFFKASFHQAGGVICYLYPRAMKKLKVKFEAELPSTAWVISHTFAIPGWQAEAIVRVNDIYRTQIYIYRSSSQSRSTRSPHSCECHHNHSQSHSSTPNKDDRSNAVRSS
jgi:hypothetical protein